MFGLFKRKTQKTETKRKGSAFTTDPFIVSSESKRSSEWLSPDVPTGMTMDSIQSSVKGGNFGVMPEAQSDWYISQGFIGYSMMAWIAKHWLVDKACNMPARDSIRRGYKINCDCADSISELSALDGAEHFDINEKMKLFIHGGRVLGGQAALFLVDSDDPEYYEYPFNIDGVSEDSYRGFSLIDPENMHPMLTAENVQDPASPMYMKPTYWMVGNRKYHHSHFVFFVPYPVTNKAKPAYNYFGVSVPERVYERTYAAERTANEAPMLAMTKRLAVLGINGYADTDKDIVEENLEYFTTFRDNYGFYVSDSEDSFTQFDTNLADLDVTIMTQYQLVAAAANVPATKLLETTPKGFNSSGGYEESSYRESLESITTNDLSKLLQRHYSILSRSLGQSHDAITVTWNPIDSPTAEEQSTIDLNESSELMNLFNSGAIDGEDIREILKNKKGSKYESLSEYEEAEEDPESWE